MDSGISLGCMRDDLDTLDPINILVLVLKGNHADQNVRKSRVMQKYKINIMFMQWGNIDKMYWWACI